MEELPFVSIIVLNWNGEATIRECLRSLIDQTYPRVRYEVIVVDNGSTDSSVDIVREEFPEVRLILNNANLGFSRGNNVGIRAARGDLIILFNNDAVADRNWLRNLVEAVLREPPEVGIASGVVYYYEPKELIWCAGGKVSAILGVAWHLMRYEGSEDIDYLPGTALLIKREVIERIGALDERFFLYAEDIDFCLRAKQAGFKLLVVLDAPVYHMVPMTVGLEKSLRAEYEKAKSEFMLLLKLWPLRYLLPAILFKLLVLPLIFALLFRHNPRLLLIAWRGFIYATRARRPRSPLKAGVLKTRLSEFLRCALERLAFWRSRGGMRRET